MSESPDQNPENERPRLRLVPAGNAPQDTGEEEPLTAEMIESLVRLRRRLQEHLFAPRMTTRPNWSTIPGGN